MSGSTLLTKYITKTKRSSTNIKKRAWGKIAPHGIPLKEPHPRLKSRNLLRYIYVLSDDIKSNPITNPEDQLVKDLLVSMDLARKMQLPGGHFKKFWKDQGVRDPNTVEFCMREIGLTHQYYQDTLKQFPEIWLTFLKISKNALGACKRRRPPEKYTNIALMNALNLMSLGIALDDDLALYEGIERFKRTTRYIWEWGIHEHLTPTYTPIQTDCLGIILDLKELPEDVINTAHQLLILIISNVMFNSAPFFHTGNLSPLDPDQPSHYNAQALNAYRDQEEERDQLIGNIFQLSRAALSDAGTQRPTSQPQAEDPILDANDFYDAYNKFISNLTLPRQVRASWGPNQNESRTHYLLNKDISLASISAPYDYPKAQDIPLAAILATNEKTQATRSESNIIPIISPDVCYLLPGVHKNPYSRKSPRHAPLIWTAAQHKSDALGFALYKPGPYRDLESTFVLPLGKGVQFWIDNNKMPDAHNDAAPEHQGLNDNTPIDANYVPPPNRFATYINPEESLFMYRNNIAIGIKIAWARDVKGGQPKIMFRYDKQETELPAKPENQTITDIFDPNEISTYLPENLSEDEKETFLNQLEQSLVDKFQEHQTACKTISTIIPAVKLTVLHNRIDDDDGHKPWKHAGAVFWVRIGGNFTDENDPNFIQWRQSFIEEIPSVDLPLQGSYNFLLRANAQDGTKLKIDTRSKDGKSFVTRITPKPSQAVIELEGENGIVEDFGRELLKGLDTIESLEENIDERIGFAQKKPWRDPLKWEAEDGLLQNPMTIKNGKHVSCGKYVWVPPHKSRPKRGSDVGNVTWSLDIPTDDNYYIWGRIRAPREIRNAFHVRIYKKGLIHKPIQLASWKLGIKKQWAWIPMDLRGTSPSDMATPIYLEQGPTIIQLFGRKPGSQIDRLFITTNPDKKP